MADRFHIWWKGTQLNYPTMDMAKACALQYFRRNDKQAELHWTFENGYCCGRLDPAVEVPVVLIKED